MSGHPAAGLAALDVLRRQGKLFFGDVAAGRKFAFLCEHRFQGGYQSQFAAALDALDSSGATAVVTAVVIAGHMPRAGRHTDRLQNGLDALHTHFTREGIL